MTDHPYGDDDGDDDDYDDDDGDGDDDDGGDDENNDDDDGDDDDDDDDLMFLALSVPQSRFGDKLLGIWMCYPLKQDCSPKNR